MKTIREKITKAISNVTNVSQTPATEPKSDPVVDNLVRSEIKAAQTETISQKVAKFHKLKTLSDKIDKEMKQVNQEIKEYYEKDVAPDKPLKERFGSYLLHLYASGGKEVVKDVVDEEKFMLEHPRIAKAYFRGLEVRESCVKQVTHTSKVVVSMKVSKDGNPYTVDEILDKL